MGPTCVLLTCPSGLFAAKWNILNYFQGQGDVGLSVWEDEMDGKMSIIDLASDYFDEGIVHLCFDHFDILCSLHRLNLS